MLAICTAASLPNLLLSLALIVFHFSFPDKSGSKNLGRFLTSPILEKRNIVLSYTDGDSCGPGRTISSNITLRCKPGRAAPAGGMVGGCPLVAAIATGFWGSESGKGWWAWVLNSGCVLYSTLAPKWGPPPLVSKGPSGTTSGGDWPGSFWLANRS